jgi:hypothetical protein
MPSASARVPILSRANHATTQAANHGSVNHGSTMNRLDHMSGRIGNGQNSCVP